VLLQALILQRTELANLKRLNFYLVDKNNHSYFYPLLYQLVTRILDVSTFFLSFRTVFKGNKNLHFRMGEFQKVIPEER
jgi:NADH dehydrogenase